MQKRSNGTMGVVQRQAIGKVVTINSQSIRVTARDNAGKVMECSGTVTISDGGAGYAVGCGYVKTNGGVGSTVYRNEGTTSSCDFNAIGTSSTDPVTIYNDVGSTLTAGTLVQISGFSSTNGITVVKADADAALKATHVVLADISNATSGIIYPTVVVTGLATNGQAIGDAVYLSATAGAFTFTAPTGIDQLTQKVGAVKVVSATIGEIIFFPGAGVNQKIVASQVRDTAGLSGLGVEKFALMVYDFAVDGGTAGVIIPSTSPTIPNKAVVWLDSYDVVTSVTSAASTATIKVGLPTDGDLSTAIAINDASAPWTAGVFSRIAGGLATPLTKKTTSTRIPQITVGVQNVTAGKIVFKLRYWVSQ